MNWRAVAAAALGVCCVLWSALGAAQQWSVDHGDGARTGRAQGLGEIQNPAIFWSQPTGGNVRDSALRLVDLDSDGRRDVLLAVGGALTARRVDGRLLWDTPALDVNQVVAVADFTGDGRLEVLAGGRAFVLLDGQTGRRLWRLTLAGGQAPRLINASATVFNADSDPQPEVLFNVGNAPASLLFYDFSRGLDGALVWRSTDDALPRAIFRPVVGQFDPQNEGLEVAVINQQGCQAAFFSLQDGQRLRLAGQDGGLTLGTFCYGLTAASDVDGDGVDELLMTGLGGAGTGSASVTLYSYTQEKILWQRQYAVGDAEVQTLVAVDAVADIDGDGRAELALAVFNNGAEVGDGGDDGVALAGRWGTMIMDAFDGTVLEVLEGCVPLGFLPDEAAQRAPLLTQDTNGQRVLPSGTLRAWGMDSERAATPLWSVSGVQPILQVVQEPRVNLYPTQTRRVWDGRRLLVLAAEPEAQLQWLRPDGQGSVTIDASKSVESGVDFSVLEPLGGSPDFGDTTHILRTNAGGVLWVDGQLQTQQQTTYVSHIAPPPLVLRGLGGAPMVILRDSAANVVAFDPSGANLLQEPQRLWSRQGQVNPSARTEGHLLGVDADGDGQDEVVHSGEGADGVPFVEVLGADGEVLWRTAVPEGVYAPFSLLTGRFGGQGEQDVAGMVRGAQGDAFVVALDGVTGELLGMHRAQPGDVNPSPGQSLLLLPDETGDGRHELLALHLSTLEKLDGATLERLGEVVALPSGAIRPGRSALLGQDAVFLNAFSDRKVVLELGDGSVRWERGLASFVAQTTGFAGQADVNGDGVLDLALPGNQGELVVLDGRDGSVVRSVCVQAGRAAQVEDVPGALGCGSLAPVSSVVVADIDGDGDEDHVFGTADGWLMALDAVSGSVSAALFLRAAVQSLVVADTDGDGALEVIATTADGRLVGVDNAATGRVEQVRDVLLDLDGRIFNPGVDIDVSVDTAAFGMAWQPVPDAEAYLINVLTQNLNVLTDWRRVTGTEAVIDGVQLIPGQTYYAQVVPFRGVGQAGQGSLSDGALVLGPGPRIFGFGAVPGVFDPSAAEETVWVATVAAADGVDRIWMEVTALGGASAEPAFVWEQDAGASARVELEVPWSGLSTSGQTLPAGLYQASLFALDGRGEAISDRALVEIRYGVPVPDEPEPEVIIINQGGGGCGCAQRPLSDPSGGLWGLVILLLALRRRFFA